jgi:ankyrin repeat protein
LKSGADINAKTTNLYTPLLRAARKGMVKNVNELLSRSADIDAKTSEGSNALIMSALSNVLDAIQFFLDKGFYINETNNKG